MAEVFDADKMNVAALGNVVPQLHIHHVARYKTYHTWPAPIWGVGDAIKYETEELELMRSKMELILLEFAAI